MYNSINLAIFYSCHFLEQFDSHSRFTKRKKIK